MSYGPRPKKKVTLQKVADAFAQRLFGVPVSHATSLLICIECKEDLDSLTDQEKADYEISGLCVKCQDKLFKEAG